MYSQASTVFEYGAVKMVRTVNCVVIDLHLQNVKASMSCVLM